MKKQEIKNYFKNAIKETGTRNFNSIFPEYHAIVREMVAEEKEFMIENGWVCYIKNWDGILRCLDGSLMQ